MISIARILRRAPVTLPHGRTARARSNRGVAPGAGAAATTSEARLHTVLPGHDARRAEDAHAPDLVATRPRSFRWRSVAIVELGPAPSRPRRARARARGRRRVVPARPGALDRGRRGSTLRPVLRARAPGSPRRCRSRRGRRRSRTAQAPPGKRARKTSSGSLCARRSRSIARARFTWYTSPAAIRVEDLPDPLGVALVRLARR